MTKTIRSIERGLQVLKALNATPISSLQDVYRLTRIPKPTLLRILHTLELSGVVSRRLADGRYRISTSLTRLGRKRDRYDRVAEAAAPVLDHLCQKVSWPSDLMVPAGDHMEVRETQPDPKSLHELLQQGQSEHAGELVVVCRWTGVPGLLSRSRTSQGDQFAS